MLGRLAIPVRLQELLAEASTEGRNLNHKIQQELPQLDISELDEMDLFSFAPSNQGTTPAPAYTPSQSPTETRILSRDDFASDHTDDQKPGGENDSHQDANGESGEFEINGKSYTLEEYVRIKKMKSPAQ